MSRSARFLWSASRVVGSWAAAVSIWMKTEQETCRQRPDGINVAEESAGKRFKVE